MAKTLSSEPDRILRFAIINLRGREREIGYRVLGEGPEWGSSFDWEFTDVGDRAELLPTMTAPESGLIISALCVAEGWQP